MAETPASTSDNCTFSECPPVIRHRIFEQVLQQSTLATRYQLGRFHRASPFGDSPFLRIPDGVPPPALIKVDRTTRTEMMPTWLAASTTGEICFDILDEDDLRFWKSWWTSLGVAARLVRTMEFELGTRYVSQSRLHARPINTVQVSFASWPTSFVQVNERLAPCYVQSSSNPTPNPVHDKRCMSGRREAAGDRAEMLGLTLLACLGGIDGCQLQQASEEQLAAVGDAIWQFIDKNYYLIREMDEQ